MNEQSPLEVLLRTVEAHADAERDSLGVYAELAERTADPIVRMLIALLIEDERRHHDLFERLAQRLRDDIEWSDTATALPTVRPSVAASSASDLKMLAGAADEERAGARELRRLAGAHRDLNAGLFTLVLESMAQDSEKHARILDFAAARLSGRV